MKKKKKLKDKSIKHLISSWKFWILISGLILLIAFGVMENILNQNQPSEDWSFGIKITEDSPNDYRKIGYIKRPNELGVAIAYVVEDGIKLLEIDLLGTIERTLLIDVDSSKVKVLNLELENDLYHIYLSDRLYLDRIDIDISTLSFIESKRISNTSEQFDSVGSTVIVGNDEITEIIAGEKTIATFMNYDNLKKVLITKNEDKIYATYDTTFGGTLIIAEEGLIIEKIITEGNQRDYGYLSDIYIDNGLITLISNKYYTTTNRPTTLGVWQINQETLNLESFYTWYHGSTSLEPRIINVSGKNISYILGNQQVLGSNTMKYTWTEKGTYVNASIYTREESELIDNTRLTITRQFPIGYDYFKSSHSEIVIWADRIEDSSHLFLAGKGEEWINQARTMHTTDWIKITQETILNFITTSIWGTFLHMINIFGYWYIILGILIISILYYNFAPFEIEDIKKHILIFIAITIFLFRFYITVINNPDIIAYSSIYPMLFQSNIVLGMISIFTSVSTMAIFVLWYREYDYSSIFLQLTALIGIDYYFYMLTILIYIVSAMIKYSSMV